MRRPVAFEGNCDLTLVTRSEKIFSDSRRSIRVLVFYKYFHELRRYFLMSDPSIWSARLLWRRLGYECSLYSVQPPRIHRLLKFPQISQIIENHSQDSQGSYHIRFISNSKSIRTVGLLLGTIFRVVWSKVRLSVLRVRQRYLCEAISVLLFLA